MRDRLAELAGRGEFDVYRYWLPCVTIKPVVTTDGPASPFKPAQSTSQEPAPRTLQPAQGSIPSAGFFMRLGPIITILGVQMGCAVRPRQSTQAHPQEPRRHRPSVPF
jgi:hypothetical protein